MSIFGNERRLFLEDEAETEKLGGELARLASHAREGLTVFSTANWGWARRP